MVGFGAYIGHLAVMRSLILPNLKDGLVRCHQRHVSGYLRDGCYHPGSSEQIFRMSWFVSWHSYRIHSNEPPFDRHDWIVRRPKTGEEVRYVIDYYSAPPEPDGSPVFSLDVRPALDSFGSLKERIAFATEEMWASFRESKQTPNPVNPSRRDWWQWSYWPLDAFLVVAQDLW